MGIDREQQRLKCMEDLIEFFKDMWGLNKQKLSGHSHLCRLMYVYVGRMGTSGGRYCWSGRSKWEVLEVKTVYDGLELGHDMDTGYKEATISSADIK